MRWGWRFIGLEARRPPRRSQQQPHVASGKLRQDRKYGFVKSVEGEPRNGSAIRYTFHRNGDEFVIENYHLDAELHLATLRFAGFSDVNWTMPRLSPDVGARAEYWQDFLHDPPIALLCCTEQGSARYGASG